MNGYRHGKGEIFAENYIRFKGDFEKDLPNGYGEIIYHNSNEFRGNFRNGKK